MPSRPAWSSVALCLVVAAADLWLVTGADRASGGVRAPLDDAYIHLQVARNLIEGGGFSFNPGEPTAVSTAPLFTALVALGGAAASGPGSWVWCGRLIGMLAHLLLALALLAAGRRALATRHGAWLFAAAAAASGALAWAAGSGMEITLAALLAVVALERHAAASASARSTFVTGALVGLGVLARPETLLLLALLALDALVHPLAPPDGAGLIGLRARLGADRRLAPLLAGASLVLAAYAAACLALGVSPLPNSYRSKAGFAGMAVTLDYLRDALFTLFRHQPALLALGGIGTLVALRTWRRGGGDLARPLWPWAFVAASAVVNPHLYNHGRYLMAVGPALALAALPALAALAGSERRLVLEVVPGGQLGVPVQRLCPWLLGAAAAVSLATLPAWQRRFAADQRYILIEEEVADRLLDAAGAGGRVAVHDIGVVGFRTRLRVHDLAGLATPEVFALRRLGPERYREAMWARWEELGVAAVASLPAHPWLPAAGGAIPGFAGGDAIGPFRTWVRTRR